MRAAVMIERFAGKRVDEPCVHSTCDAFFAHSHASGNPAWSSTLGTNQAAVVPAQAGTHNHQDFGCRWPATSPCCGVWVPACAGTTAESHCLTSSQAGIQDYPAPIDCAPGSHACPREGGEVRGRTESPASAYTRIGIST